jgi:hypothetical protein
MSNYKTYDPTRVKKVRATIRPKILTPNVIKPAMNAMPSLGMPQSLKPVIRATPVSTGSYPMGLRERLAKKPRLSSLLQI